MGRGGRNKEANSIGKSGMGESDIENKGEM